MSAVQMNVRIDSAVKAEGDAAFAECGYSPSEAARLVWSFAARNRHRLKAVRTMIDNLRDPQEIAAEERAQQKKHDDIKNWIDRGQDVIEAFYEEMGIERPAYEPLTQEQQDAMLADYLEQDNERERLGLSWDEFDTLLGKSEATSQRNSRAASETRGASTGSAHSVFTAAVRGTSAEGDER